MSKLTTWLSVALAAQLLITGALFVGGKQGQNHDVNQPLLAYDRDALNRIVISADDTSVALNKKDSQWQLDVAGGLAVDSDKLSTMLERFGSLKKGWPVATTDASQTRLEVAEDKYQKKVQLFAGDKLTDEFYLGTSPGFKKVHVRKAGESVIYNVALNAHDLSNKADDWLDKNLLDMENISRIAGADFTLHQEAGAEWAFQNEENIVEKNNVEESNVEENSVEANNADDSQTPIELDEAKAEELVQAIAKLRVRGVADKKLDAVPLKISVTGASGEKQYRFAELDNNYYVRRDDIDSAFIISKFDYERIAKFNRTELAKRPVEEAEERENS